MQMKKLVVIGVGLIGGSLALDLKRAGAVTQVVGVGRSWDNLERALQLGVIDHATQSAAEAVVDADIVLLATPVGQMAALLQQIAPHLAPHTIVTDAGSTKSDVCALMQQYLPHHLARCVPAHPIAGSDLSGASAARYGLYQNRNVVLAPFAETDASALAEIHAMWQITGAHLLQMTASEHDAVFAAVSHLPHLLAFAYVDMVAQKENAERCLALAASGFRDFTRIAGSHPEMWRDISLANRDALLADLHRYQAVLASLTHALENHDGEALATQFQRARHVRTQWEHQQR